MARSRSPPRERKRDRSKSPGRDRLDRDPKRKRDERDKREERERSDRRDRNERDDRRDRRPDARDDGRDKTRRKRSRSPGKDEKDRKPETVVKQDANVKLEEDANGQPETKTEIKKKAEPLSLEELLRKKKEQQELESKPKFLSKAEREALALAKRAQEVSVQRAGTAALAAAARADQDSGRREAERKRADEERKKYQEDREKEKELELIKQQYLGQEKVKKKVLRPSEKFRFNFDWETTDDTSRDLNPLYNNLHEATLLFGRGFRAGIDRREQKKANALQERDMVRQLREKAGIKETGEMRAADAEAAAKADKYDGFDMHIEKHWTEKALEDMQERDWRIFREDFNISYKGSNTNVNPMRSWDEADIPKLVKKAIEKIGYKKPSPIQMASIPLGLQQRDVIGIAETGSGKTAAFVIPMLAYIMKQPPMTEENEADGPYAVVLAPTRELAQQIEEETLKLAYYTSYRVCSVVGGVSIEEQGSKLRRGCEIVIATPGRMVDCLQRHYCVLNQCNYVVMDEADRMVDLGFESQVMGVLDAMPSSNLKPENEEEPLESSKVYRTTYMFSATMPPQVERIAKKYMRRPVVVTIGTAGDVTSNVTQRVMMVKDNEKPARLRQELDAVEEKRAIVFVNTKRQCDNVYKILEEDGYACTILHSGKTQQQREAGIKGFRDLTYNILIATDVAGRGIDIPDVALVINYDMPNNIEQYTHRIGRTGRAGKKGIAATFLTGHDTEVYYDLKKKLEESKANVPPELARHDAARMKPGMDGKKKKDDIQYASR